MAIRVNEVWISSDEIHREMQNHPAPSRDAAEREAARALLVRQILLQEAIRTGRLVDSGSDGTPAAREEAIADLLEETIQVEEPDEATCRALYERCREKLKSPNLFKASHILFLAPPGDQEARDRARALVRETLALLAADPSRFEELARDRSECSSARSGGSLGQLQPGDTVRDFAAALAALTPGQIRPQPLETRFGLHVVRLDEFAPGRPLPFEAAEQRLRDYLREQRWRERFQAYLRGLASRMEIVGFDVEKGVFAEQP